MSFDGIHVAEFSRYCPSSEHLALKGWYGETFNADAPPADELRLEVLKLAKRWKPKKKPN